MMYYSVLLLTFLLGLSLASQKRQAQMEYLTCKLKISQELVKARSEVFKTSVRMLHMIRTLKEFRPADPAWVADTSRKVRLRYALLLNLCEEQNFISIYRWQERLFADAIERTASGNEPLSRIKRNADRAYEGISNEEGYLNFLYQVFPYDVAQ